MREALLLLALVVSSCGGDDGSAAKDWSGASLLERAMDFCVKQIGCGETEGSVASCIDTTADLASLPAEVPTRRDLEDLVDLRGCYNRARSCQAVHECAGVPEGEDPQECNPATHAASCRSAMGVSILKHCVNGLVIETDCTKLGLVCAFDSEGHNRCVAETCNAATYTPSCDTESGDLNTCGEIGASSPGTVVYQYACGAIGMGCSLDLGDPEVPGDEQFTCTGRGEGCDPAAAEPSCDGASLSVCQPNLDGSGNVAEFDCGAGTIHKTCDATVPGCTRTTTTCDPAQDQGSCDGTDLIVCVDGALQTIDCRAHGLATCKPGTPAICAESR